MGASGTGTRVAPQRTGAAAASSRSMSMEADPSVPTVASASWGQVSRERLPAGGRRADWSALTTASSPHDPLSPVSPGQPYAGLPVRSVAD